MCSAFATREKSGEITPACVRWLGRDVREAPTTKDRDFVSFGFALEMTEVAASELMNDNDTVFRDQMTYNKQA